MANQIAGGRVPPHATMEAPPLNNDNEADYDGEDDNFDDNCNSNDNIIMMM